MKTKDDRLRLLAFGSIAVALAVLALKTGAWWVTGSVALYSDALESVINVVTAVLALGAIVVSARPADSNHPYGHGKAEYLSAVLEGVMIIIAAAMILREAYIGFLDPRPIDAPAYGLAISGGATIINALWSALLLRRGRELASPALVADGRHLQADVATTAGVIFGIALQAATGWAVLDPLLAAVVAVNILWSGWHLVKQSVGGLMDEAASPETVERIRVAISRHAVGAIEAHDLRTRGAGRRTFVDFHLVVPGSMSVAEAHDICDAIEQALKSDVEGAFVTIHVEPENKAKHSGVIVL